MPSPASLVSLDQAKRQLRITHEHEDEDIQDKLWEAEDIVLRYLNGGDAAWDEESLPGAVKAAILRQTMHLFRHRGDGLEPVNVDSHGLAPGVAFMLVAYRRQSLA